MYMKITYKIILAACILFLSPLTQAYIGPGAGLSAIGTVIAFIGAILLLIVGFLWYPIKRFIKGKQDNSSNEQPLTKSDSEKPDQ